MADVIAVVSKAVFEKELRAHRLEVGKVWPTEAYVSQNKGLAPLGDGGRLFLVTVRPPDETLWLVAVLEQPKSDGTQWKANANLVPIRDVSSIKKSLRFETGAGLPDKPGVLGMSLQTPRVLAASDIPLLLGGAPAPVAPAPKPAAPATGVLSFEEVVKIWRSSRSARFGAIADAIAAKEPERPALPASAKKVDIAAWDETEAAGDWRDWARLIAALTGAHSATAKERIEVMAKRNDPRFVTALLAITEDPPYTAGTSKKFWQAVVAALEATKDPRARDGMTSLSTRYTTINDTHMGAWVAQAMSKAAARMKDPRALSANEEAELASLEVAYLGESGATAPKPVAASTVSLAELLQAIIDGPNDDDPRLVYADVLSERGDERGELIMLQIERAAGRATPERADLEREKYGPRLKEWGPPLSTAADHIVFDRGFPAFVQLTNRGLAQVADAVEWGTVHTVDNVAHAPVKAALQLLDSDFVKNLVEVRDLTAKFIEKLKKPTYPWRRVAFRNEGYQRDSGVPAAQHVQRFPDLTHMEIRSHGPLDSGMFAAAPNVRSIVLAQPNLEADGDLFVNNEKLEALTFRRRFAQADEASRFAGLKIRELDVPSDAGAATEWLRAIPSLRTLKLDVTEIDWKGLIALFDAQPKLEHVTFRRFRGSFTGALEPKGTKGDFTLTLPPGERWVGFVEELVREAPALRELGVSSLVLYPSAPRHKQVPMTEASLDPIRAAWPELDVRDVL